MIIRFALALIALVLCSATPASAQSGVNWKNAGTFLGRATTIECGSGIDCGFIGGTGTLTVTGSMPTGIGYASPCFTVGSDVFNQVVMCGSLTGNPVTFAPAGSDTNINLLMSPKGGGSFDIAVQNWNNTVTTGFRILNAVSLAEVMNITPINDTLSGSVTQYTFSKGLHASDDVGGNTQISNMNTPVLDQNAAGEIGHYFTVIQFNSDKGFLGGTVLGVDNDFRHTVDDRWMFRIVEGHGQNSFGFPDSQALIGINTIGTPAAVLHIVNPSVANSVGDTNATVVQTVEGVTTQSAHLTDWKLTGGAVRAFVDKDGGANFGGTLTAGTRTGTPATFASFDSSGKLVAGAAYAAPVGPIAGTSNQISASAASGSVTLSLPSSVTMPGDLTVTTRTGTPATFTTFDSGGKLVAGATYSAPVGPIAGTANQITASAASGSVTLSLPAAVTAPGSLTLTTRTGTPATLATFDATGKLVAGAVYPGATGPTATTGGIIGGGFSSGGATQPLFGNSATDTAQTAGMPSPGYVRGLYVTYAAAQAAGARTIFSLRPNQQPQGIDMMVSDAAAAGTYTVPYLMRFEKNSMADLKTQAYSGTTATTPVGWSSEYLMDDGGIILGTYWANAPTLSGATRFLTLPYSINGSGGLFTTEPIAAVPIPITGTLKNFCLATNNNQDASGTMVVTVVVNGSATAITVTVPVSALSGSVFCDYTHTAAITANQTLSVQVVNNATAGSGGLRNATIELLPTSGTSGIIGGGSIGAVASGSTAYWKPLTRTTNATEANVQVPMPRAGTMTNFCVQRSVAASVGTTTATIFKNGSASGQLTMTLANATGPQCATGSVAIAAGDTLSMEVKNSVACTGGCPTLGGWSADF